MSRVMAAPTDGDMVSIRQRAAIAARLRSTIEQSFAHREAVPELDFDAAFERYLDEALAAPTRLAFVLAGQRLMAQLRNGHSGFHDDWVMQRHGRSFGLMLRPLAGRWTVTISRHAELPVGTVVERIDDMPMAELFAHCRPFLATSSDRAAADILFYRRHLLPDALTLGLEGGGTFALAKADWPVLETPLPSLEHRGRVAVLPIRSFDDQRFEAAAVAAVRALDGDTPLIIDLRGNGGGNTPLGLLAALMDRPYRRWRSTVLGSTTLRRAYGERPEVVAYEPHGMNRCPGRIAGRWSSWSMARSARRRRILPCRSRITGAPCWLARRPRGAAGNRTTSISMAIAPGSERSARHSRMAQPSRALGSARTCRSSGSPQICGRAGTRSLPQRWT